MADAVGLWVFGYGPVILYWPIYISVSLDYFFLCDFILVRLERDGGVEMGADLDLDLPTLKYHRQAKHTTLYRNYNDGS